MLKGVDSFERYLRFNPAQEKCNNNKSCQSLQDEFVNYCMTLQILDTESKTGLCLAAQHKLRVECFNAKVLWMEET